MSQTPNYVMEIVRRSADGDTPAQIAAALQVSEDWLAIVMSSDAYAVIAHDYVRPSEEGRRTS